MGRGMVSLHLYFFFPLDFGCYYLSVEWANVDSPSPYIRPVGWLVLICIFFLGF